jgi:hypothetical protein
MSFFTLLPVWIAQAKSMGASFTTDSVKMAWEDNFGIQMVWTGTPTGVIEVQVSMDPDNLGWETIPFNPSLTQPAGAAGTNWAEVNQTTAAYVRLKYTRTSGTGTFNAKISAKSV